MKLLLQLEQAAIFGAAIYFLNQHGLGWHWWVWALLFFSPDLGMLGYFIHPKMGAWGYNFFHHQGVAIALMGTGWLMHQEGLLAAGLLLLSHSAFDRVWGYGLKYNDQFNHTHLGMVGKQK
jgi:Domain of unknown function (DUF4260)